MKPLLLTLSLLLCGCNSREAMPMSHYLAIALMIVCIMAISFGSYWDAEEKKAKELRIQEADKHIAKLLAENDDFERRYAAQEALDERIATLRDLSNRPRHSKSTLTNTRY